MVGVYIATAIDQVPDGHGDSERQDLVRWLTGVRGVDWVYDPKSAFSVSPTASIGPGIRQINAAALESADLLLAVLPAGTVSVGVPMEIERALSLGLEVVVVSDAKSWMLSSPGIYTYKTLIGAKAHLLRFASGLEDLEFLRKAREDISEPLASSGRAEMPFKLAEGAKLPTRGHDDDAGLDLYVSEDVEIQPGQFMDIPTGVYAQLPDWCWGFITGRSSTLRRRGLLVNQGVIDAGYRGELFAGVFNLSGHKVKVKKGERLAQLILLENGTLRVEPTQVDELQDGSRNLDGFGSTGA